jgi:hypothetical protein
MCPISFLMLGSTLQDLPSDPPAACQSACRRQASLRTGSHQRTILACTPPILVGYAVEPATAPPPPTTTARSTPTPRLAQHHLRQPRARGSDSGRPRAGHGRSGRPRRPRPSQPCGCRPHRHAPGPHSRQTHGRRRPDTGHLDAQTPAPDTDHWTGPTGTPDTRTGHRTPDTGHRTPDAGQERGHGDDGRAGVRTSVAATPSDRTLRRPTVFALPTTSRLLGRSAGQAAPRRTAVLGRLRVERRAAGSGSSVMASRSAEWWERE